MVYKKMFGKSQFRTAESKFVASTLILPLILQISSNSKINKNVIL